MIKVIDLTGQKFGRLKVIKISEKDKQGKYKWLCKCECGNMTKVRRVSLKSGATKSCGCLRKEIMKQKQIIHNRTFTSEYNIWSGMKDRCLNKKNKDYRRYGERGITICKEWKNSFANFYKDMGDRPKGMSIDRIDNNLGYYKENCHYASPKQQARNRRDNKTITYKGETLCMSEWAERLNIRNDTLMWRLKNNWNIEKAFTT